MKHYFIDLFCGAGGVSTGAARAGATVIACVNHDPLAIASHAANHPNVLHFTEDIRKLDLSQLRSLVNAIRDKESDCMIHLWASLECTNFSKAKGGQPREADSRTLADHLFRYVDCLDPDCIEIENVEEFMSWGPLDDKGKPVSKRNGSDYVKWCNKMQGRGYRFDYRILDAANYGAYTTRKRYFAQFVKPEHIISWPEPTHSKNPKSDQFGELKKHKPVKEVLDFTDEGNSIFGRKKPLSPKTMARIYAGLVKYVANGDQSFLSKYFSGDPGSKNVSIDRPAGSITTRDHHSIVTTHMLLKYNSTSSKGIHVPPSIDDPCPTVACQSRLGLVSFISTYHGNGNNVHSVDKVCPSVLAADTHAIVNAKWIDKHYSGSANHQSIEKPLGTILTKDKYSVVSTSWIDRNFSQGGKHNSVDGPAGSILSVPKMNLVQPQFIMDTQFRNGPASVEQPSRTITANRKHHYLVNPQFQSKGSSIDNPCFTLIARMDKIPPHLVSKESGEVAIELLESDCDFTIKIKLFMAEYGIADIKMRMLRVDELLRIQGFPSDYKLHGTQADKKKFIGNAVEVNMATALISHIIKTNNEKRLAA